MHPKVHRTDQKLHANHSMYNRFVLKKELAETILVLVEVAKNLNRATVKI